MVLEGVVGNQVLSPCIVLGIRQDFSFQGLFMLWRGMLPALYRHAIYTGIRMSAYEEIRDTLLRENKVTNCLDQGPYSLNANCLIFTYRAVVV